jgi:hypothetical protein
MKAAIATNCGCRLYYLDFLYILIKNKTIKINNATQISNKTI